MLQSNRKLLIILGLLLVGYYLFNPKVFSQSSVPTITVSGTSSTEQTNQVATFNAGVYSINDNKELAVNDVNTKIDQIVTSLKTFGIPENDIKTQNLSIYQMEEPQSVGSSRTMPGQWRVSTDIQITLRNIDQSTDLASLLTSSGANNVYGPNFSIDQANTVEIDLLNQAVEDATTKAQSVANANNKKIGKVVSIIEGGAVNPVLPMSERMMGGGGGSALMPGSTTVSKTVSVTFELK